MRQQVNVVGHDQEKVQKPIAAFLPKPCRVKYFPVGHIPRGEAELRSRRYAGWVDDPAKNETGAAPLTAY